MPVCVCSFHFFKLKGHSWVPFPAPFIIARYFFSWNAASVTVLGNRYFWILAICYKAVLVSSHSWSFHNSTIILEQSYQQYLLWFCLLNSLHRPVLSGPGHHKRHRCDSLWVTRLQNKVWKPPGLYVWLLQG